MKAPEKITSITALHQYLKLKKPSHPLVSVFDFNEVHVDPETILSAVTTDFYVISIKKDCAGRCKYGQHYYDFEDGIMYFIAPYQVLQFEDILLSEVKGNVLVIHPDFLHGYPLARTIKDYGYFSYMANEALYLSEKEEKSVTDIMNNISREIETNMDGFTQDLLVSNLDLLLKYCDRFYNRQFLTRKKVNHDLLTQLETLLNEYFKDEKLLINGIPTVQLVAAQMNISPNYLSDMLRVLTGQTTQQHIQNRVIEKAKEMLSTTGMSVSEIAYRLGFEHPQSFHRLFKNQTAVSPLEFRKSFN
ncbi:AraC family transcriptional regulator [Chryseobacterium sp. 7]|uniref:helix-turn-helix domain-containing protein n=1 Tax=Chryseobacterium sp. 7 TaxID=2035214 RepID=UPI000EAD781D|nr:response regulator transcription factor [Chryseobacterium sp. 7]RLJ32633.1 AraC family transcriptional regulator [Chryseobacterium sp. 7]